jgi:hypothetical protein
MDRLTSSERQRDQRMAHLMVGDGFALMGIEQPVLLFETRNDPLHGRRKIGHRYLGPLPPRGDERGFVDQIRQVCAGEARVSPAIVAGDTSAANFTFLR